MNLFKRSLKIKKGEYITVSSAYGNHKDEVINDFLKNGWTVKNIVHPDYKRGDKTMFITFESGENAKPVNIYYPNADILK